MTMIALPSVEDLEQYGRRVEPRSLGIPLIADEEAVCSVRVTGTGSGAYWSRGDVDVHVLHARQHGLVDGFVQQGWLAAALRERREQRLRLLRSGVQTTASGLVVLRPQQTQLILPPRP